MNVFCIQIFANFAIINNLTKDNGKKEEIIKFQAISRFNY